MMLAERYNPNRDKKELKNLNPFFSLWLSFILVGSILGRSFVDDSGGPSFLYFFVLFIIWPVVLYFYHEDFKKSLSALLKDRKFMFFLVSYVIAMTISVLLGLFSVIALSYVIATFICFVIAYSFSFCMTDEEMSRGLAIYSLLAMMILIYYAYSSGLDFKGRLGGILNPNSVGMISVSVIMASFLNKKWWLIIIAAIPASVVLYFTNSRAAIAALFIGMFTLLILKNRKLPNFKKMGLLCFFTAFAIPLLFKNGEAMQNLISSIFDLDDRYRGLTTGGTGRIEAWREAWAIFLSNPISGVGYRMHEYYMRFYTSAHNGYLATLADTGILGFGITAYLFVRGIRIYIRISHESFSIWSIAVIFAFLFIAFFERYLINIGNPMSILIVTLLIRGFTARAEPDISRGRR